MEHAIFGYAPFTIIANVLKDRGIYEGSAYTRISHFGHF